ncbi:Hypothetical predicted protein [Cloeon dipterum]|uniref:Uncharacterized protein n=1 Tax=Cloeon dipterum TaxID=197152 RepID=A0A8S1CBV7_9INSE|nr:Hypothetical predicted protein [Cloeon dipterum]
MDVEKLKIAKRRIAELRGKAPLQLENMLVKSVAENIARYVEYQQLSTLNANIRRMVMAELLKKCCHDQNGDADQLQDLLRALPQLLDLETLYLDLTNLMTFCYDYLKKICSGEVLAMIALHSPKILSLTMEETRKMHLNSNCLSQDMVNSIRNLKNLTALKMDVCKFLRTDLIQTCKELVFLRDLKVEIVFDHYVQKEDDFDDFIDKLKNLKEFRFKTFVTYEMSLIESSDYQRKLSHACFKGLPNLEVIGSDATGADVPFNMSLFCFDQEVVSDLRHLQIVLNEFQGPESYEKFPNVTHLKIGWCPENVHSAENLNSLLHFPKLLHLSLVELPNKLLLCKLLEKYGPQLQTLSIGNKVINTNLILREISQTCPKLEIFFLSGRIYVPDVPQDMPSFPHLKHLHWNILSAQGQILTLQKIFSAPNLEKVNLTCQKMGESDLLNLSSLVENRQILSKLTSFELFFDPIMHSPTTYITCSNLLKNMITYLPNLLNVNVVTRDWKKLLKVVCSNKDLMLLKFLSTLQN